MNHIHHTGDRALNIALLTFSDLAFFNIEMAKVLQREYGCRIHLYVSSAEALKSHQVYLEQGVAASVTAWDVFYQEAAKSVQDAAAIRSRAVNIEQRLGYPLSHILMTMRDAGRGFAMAGLHHPRVPGVDALSHDQCLHGICEQVLFWEREFRDKQIDVVAHGFKHAEAGAALADVSYRYMYSSRQENYYYWAHNAFMTPPGLQAAFDATDTSTIAPVDLSVPYFQETTHQAAIRSGNDYVKLLRKAWRLSLREAYLRLKGYRGTQSYSYLSTLSFYLRNHLDLRRLSCTPAQPLAALQGRRYVFFPLQTEPEQSVQWMSPECLSQLALIASLARDLPADTLLAVKDSVHAVGRRPLEFYRQIAEFKNVVLLNVYERGLDVIKQAAATATISGSAGLEAAIMGLPVILFGRHNGYEFLDHVYPVYREEDLRPAVLAALASGAPSENSRRDGARLRQSLIDVSFDLIDYTNANIHAVNPEAAANAAHALMDSLAPIDPHQSKKENTTQLAGHGRPDK